MKATKDSLPFAVIRQYEVELAREAAICFAIGFHQNVVSVRGVFPRLSGVSTNAKGLLVLLDLAGSDLEKAMGKEGDGALYAGASREDVERRLLSITRQLYEGLWHCGTCTAAVCCTRISNWGT